MSINIQLNSARIKSPTIYNKDSIYSKGKETNRYQLTIKQDLMNDEIVHIAGRSLEELNQSFFSPLKKHLYVIIRTNEGSIALNKNSLCKRLNIDPKQLKALQKTHQELTAQQLNDLFNSPLKMRSNLIMNLSKSINYSGKIKTRLAYNHNDEISWIAAKVAKPAANGPCKLSFLAKKRYFLYNMENNHGSMTTYKVNINSFLQRLSDQEQSELRALLKRGENHPVKDGQNHFLKTYLDAQP